MIAFKTYPISLLHLFSFGFTNDAVIVPVAGVVSVFATVKVNAVTLVLVIEKVPLYPAGVAPEIVI